MMFDFTKQEIEEIKSKIYLTELQEKILDMKLKGNLTEYGNYSGNYGDNYGRRGYDAKYRGYDHIDRMGENYGRYMEGRERYGANSEDTKRSLKYMLESMEDFAKMLREEAQSQEEVQMIRETAQRIASM